MRRYVIGAMCGAIAFAATYGLLIAVFEATRGRTIRLRNLADLVFALSVINMLMLLAVHGPILLAIRRFFAGVMGPAPAALLTMCLAVTSFFAAWLMFRESNETIIGLVLYIRSVPAEFTINLIPNLVSAGLFGMWILSSAVTRSQRATPKA